MKRLLKIVLIILVSLMFVSELGLYPQGIVKKRRTANRETIERRREADLARIEKIKRDLGAFRDEVDRRLGPDGKMRIDDPIDIERIDDVRKLDHYHTKNKVPPREFAYVNGERVVMRSEGGLKSDIIGRLEFSERVEVLAQTEQIDTIRHVEAPWILVRRASGDEGWVFGVFLQKRQPKRKEDFGTFGREQRGREFRAPVDGTITGRYGYRVHPVTKRRESFHAGLDIAAKTGTPVRASADGTVVKAGYRRNGYGKLIIIEHGRELATWYGHLSVIGVTPGQKVRRGDIIGAVGRTGNATGPHLHFEVRRGGTACDPEAFLP